MLYTTRVREEYLRKQIDLTDQRTTEVIAIESRALKELDIVEGQETLVPNTSAEGLALQLSPSTQSILEDIPPGFQENTLDLVLLETYLALTPL